MPPVDSLPMAGTRFPNLDGLRFMAAALVVLDHLQQHKANLGLPFLGDRWHWDRIGHLGVLLFFVLSGFLITYLLLEEERDTGRIHYGRFQMRRVLRIWPLYFLLVFLAVLVFPHWDVMAMPEEPSGSVPRRLLLYTLFLPSLVPALAGAVPHAGHLWSIGTEVHFYFLWPALLMLVRRRRLLLVLAVILSFPVGYRLLDSSWMAWLPGQRLFFHYWGQLNVESLGCGALFALAAFYRSRVLAWLLDMRLFLAAVAATIALMFLLPHGPHTYRACTFLFGLVILNLAINPKVGRPLEWGPLRYLGRISYGIYLYHLAVIVLVVNGLAAAGRAHDVLIYPLVFGGTIAVAALSFRFFEGFFQRLRHRFQPAGREGRAAM